MRKVLFVATALLLALDTLSAQAQDVVAWPKDRVPPSSAGADKTATKPAADAKNDKTKTDKTSPTTDVSKEQAPTAAAPKRRVIVPDLPIALTDKQREEKKKAAAAAAAEDAAAAAGNTKKTTAAPSVYASSATVSTKKPTSVVEAIEQRLKRRLTEEELGEINRARFEALADLDTKKARTLVKAARRMSVPTDLMESLLPKTAAITPAQRQILVGKLAQALKRPLTGKEISTLNSVLDERADSATPARADYAQNIKRITGIPAGFVVKMVKDYGL